MPGTRGGGSTRPTDPYVTGALRTAEPVMVREAGLAGSRLGGRVRWPRITVASYLLRTPRAFGEPVKDPEGLPAPVGPDDDYVSVEMNRSTAEQAGAEPWRTWVMWIRLADGRRLWSGKPFDMRREVSG